MTVKRREDGKWEGPAPGLKNRVIVGPNEESVRRAMANIEAAHQWREKNDSDVWAKIEEHGNWRLKEIVLMLWNGDLGRCLAGLDMEGSELAWRAIEQYARHGENDKEFMRVGDIYADEAADNAAHSAGYDDGCAGLPERHPSEVPQGRVEQYKIGYEWGVKDRTSEE